MDRFEISAKMEFLDLISKGEVYSDSILEIRNQVGVRMQMYRSAEIGIAEHAEWLSDLKKRNDKTFYAVIFDGSLVGCVGIYNVSRENRRADWSFYLSSEFQGKGLGGAIEIKVLDDFLLSGVYDKLNCEVLATNQAVINMHKGFGFSIEGVRRAHIQRDNDALDVVLLGIKAEEWRENRAKLIANGSIKSDEQDKYMNIIDEIEKIRGKNNKNWMDLLRLSFKCAPREASEIVAGIYRDDGRISELAKELLR